MLTWGSCSNHDNSVPSSPDQVEQNVQNGAWIITDFNDSGKDETAHFTGYAFTFGTDGTLTASNGSSSYSGNWSVTDSNSSDDNPDDMHFNIIFNLSNNFEDLNDDWHILTQSETKIELIDISGGNGGTDYLTFELN
ncbi:MAG: hypothetical protein H6571_10470 [Lewinellaceae bacterium]|nr:hypothetical protein [Lewinellaceae bacterium]